MPRSAVYTAGDGSTWLFTPTVGAGGATTYQSPAGIQATLAVSAARWYNTLTGTWTQRATLDSPLDPHNADRYAFTGGDPINASAPSGKSSFLDYATESGKSAVFSLGMALLDGTAEINVGAVVDLASG